METTVTSRSQLKRERVRTVAQQLFVQAGFAATSMDIIAATAGVSKPTLYRYYANKEALFADVLRDLSIRRVWNDVPPVAAEASITSRADLSIGLIALAQSALPRLLDPIYLGLLRVLIAEIPRFPQLAALFRASVLEDGPRVLSSVLERARAAGVIRLSHQDVTVRLFIGPLLSYVLTEGLLTPPEAAHPPTAEDVAALVDLFITAIT